jgi:hypothetical protein
MSILNTRLGLICFCVAAALFAVYFGSMRFARGEWDQVPFESVVAGKAVTPFQYRVLVPWTVGFAEKTVLPLPGIANGRKLAFLIEVASIFLTLLAFRLYIGAIVRKEPLASLLAWSGMFIIPFNYWLSGMWMFWMWYDMPSLLFFTLGLWLLRERVWWGFYPVFVLGTLNRETTCFLTMVLVLTEWGGDKWIRRVVPHVLTQAAIWVGIKWLLFVMYRHNPGVGLSLNNLGSNIEVLTHNPYRLFIFLSSLAYLWLPVTLFFPLIGDKFVRRACLVGVPFLAVMLVSGNAPELRIYGEMIPVVLPAYILIVMGAIRGAEPGKREEGRAAHPEGSPYLEKDCP